MQPLDPIRGSDIDKLKDKNKQGTKESEEKNHESPLLLGQNADESLFQGDSEYIDIGSRKTENIKHIDHFLNVSSHIEFSYIAKKYLKKNKSLIKTPDATAYDFLKAKQKIPINHVVYELFPYLALKLINNDKNKLEDSLAQLFKIAKSLNIKDMSEISFEDIIKLKNTLRNNFKQKQQQNIEPDTEKTNSVDDKITSDIIHTDNSNDIYFDEIDISYIKATTTDKLSITEAINRIKRKILNRRYYILLDIFFIIFSIAMFALPIINILTIYAAISLTFLIILPIIYSSIASGITRVKIAIKNRYITKNLDKGLEILNSNKELSANEAKIIKKLRESYAFLFDTIYSSEIHNLYAEIEKLQQEITITDNNSLQAMKGEINKIKIKEKIKIKQQNITEYLQLYERIYYLEMKEVEYNTAQFEKVFIPRLNHSFSPFSLEQQQQIIDRALDSKGLNQQINAISLLTIDADTDKLDGLVSKKHSAKNIIKDKLSEIISLCKDITKDRIQSSLEYFSKKVLSRSIPAYNINHIIDTFLTPLVSPHGYYIFFFSMLLNSMQDKFGTYRNKKRMLDIKLGKSGTTGILFGMINPRMRTKREQVSTIIEVQKKTSMQQLKLMKQYNNTVKKNIKMLQKNATISPEYLIKMLINFQYYHLQSILLANDSTANFLSLMQEKRKELQQEFATTSKN